MSDNDILNNLNEKQRRDKFIKKNYSELHNRISEFVKINNLECGFTESIFLYSGNRIGECKICKNKTKFRGFNVGYNTYCSRKCSMNDRDVVDRRNEKSISSCLSKYGVVNASKLDCVKEKTKKTNLEKYGVDNYSKTDEYLSKTKETNNLRYGTDWFMKTDEFFNMSKSSKIDKWGVDHHTKSSEFKEDRKLIMLDKYGVDNYARTSQFKSHMDNYYKSDKFKLDTTNNNIKRYEKVKEYYSLYNGKYSLIEIDDNILRFKCSICNNKFETSKQLYYLRNKNGMDCCTICNPTNGKNTSVCEKELLNFIKGNYDGEIVENYKIGRVESDIYLPDLKIGFEYNGLWYHSEFFKKRNYHRDKNSLFREKNIQIVMIWEDDWMYRRDIVESIILNKIGKCKRKVWARKCKIVEVSDNREVKKFLDENHIQGSVNSKYKVGLYLDKELVSIMTFGSLRKSLGSKGVDGEYELIRFCNKKNTLVVGGASRILKFFKDRYSPKSIISYGDKCYTNGGLYEKLGFKLDSETQPNYYWSKNGIRYNRFSFRKDILVSQGFDKSMTELEIMHSRGYQRVFNCGNYKFLMV